MTSRWPTMLLVAAATGIALHATAGSASALPRFAARTGRDCSHCHVNPSGGGPRNAFGRVFARVWLPLAVTSRPLASDPLGSFDGQLTDWLALGADLRAAYLWARPDHAVGDPERRGEITSSFFLMQGALYVDATLGAHVTMMLALSVYSGVEAWALLRLRPEPARWNLMIKAGRFMPAFGLRDVQHQLYTRGGVGFGNADRDTGMELVARTGPFTAQLAIFNGSLGDSAFDTRGSEATWFQKALVGRTALRLDVGVLRLQLGASFYYGGNGAQVNPAFTGALPPAQVAETSAGVDELRAGTFVAATLGRIGYVGEIVWVRDAFVQESLAAIEGYASYQELHFLAVRGLDFAATLEFRDRDLSITGDWALRAGIAVELFPFPFTELRVAVRREWSEVSATGGIWDFIGFVHLYP